jgi:hypothetical protein
MQAKDPEEKNHQLSIMKKMKISPSVIKNGRGSSLQYRELTVYLGTLFRQMHMRQTRRRRKKSDAVSSS